MIRQNTHSGSEDSGILHQLSRSAIPTIEKLTIHLISVLDTGTFDGRYEHPSVAVLAS
jgi:hypothetical protein